MNIPTNCVQRNDWYTTVTLICDFKLLNCGQKMTDIHLWLLYVTWNYLTVNKKKLTDIQLWLLHVTWNYETWKYLTVNKTLDWYTIVTFICDLKLFNCEQKIISGSLKNVLTKICLQIKYVQYICVNTIWHKNPTNQPEKWTRKNKKKA